MRKICSKRRGSSLVEVLIAVGVVAIALVGIMSSVAVARLAVEHRQRGDAHAAALRVLEWAETVPLSADIYTKFRDAFGGDRAKFGTLTVTIKRTIHKLSGTQIEVSADVTVTVTDDDFKTSLKREVSRSAMQNAGELP